LASLIPPVLSNLVIGFWFVIFGQPGVKAELFLIEHHAFYLLVTARLRANGEDAVVVEIN
jgi:hypothetical protein